ncbi:MAG: hypothetical protein ACKOCN_04135, partial [Planctomycetaceae bacterium]
AVLLTMHRIDRVRIQDDMCDVFRQGTSESLTTRFDSPSTAGKSMRRHVFQLAAFLGVILIGIGSADAQNTNQVGGGNITNQLTASSAGDFFEITGQDTITGVGQGIPLQAAAWETYTLNNLIGPEISLGLESEHGRWTFTSDFKFTAGFNWQNNVYSGANFPASLGADYLRTTFTPTVTQTNDGSDTNPIAVPAPPLFLQVYGIGQSNATNDADYNFVFSPVGEWRFGAEFRVSRAIRLKAGYTGMWLANIARASTNTGYETVTDEVEYARPEDPTDPESPWIVDTRPVEYNRITGVNGGQEYVFTNGVDFGIEFTY